MTSKALVCVALYWRSCTKCAICVSSMTPVTPTLHHACKFQSLHAAPPLNTVWGLGSSLLPFILFTSTKHFVFVHPGVHAMAALCYHGQPWLPSWRLVLLNGPRIIYWDTIILNIYMTPTNSVQCMPVAREQLEPVVINHFVDIHVYGKAGDDSIEVIC